MTLIGHVESVAESNAKTTKVDLCKEPDMQDQRLRPKGVAAALSAASAHGVCFRLALIFQIVRKLLERHLAAILAADVVGYPCLMGEDLLKKYSTPACV